MLLIPLSVVLVFAIGAVFLWSVRSGQFDDLDGPAHRVVADDDRPRGKGGDGSPDLINIKPADDGQR